jgi:hypothetical protein
MEVIRAERYFSGARLWLILTVNSIRRFRDVAAILRIEICFFFKCLRAVYFSLHVLLVVNATLNAVSEAVLPFLRLSVTAVGLEAAAKTFQNLLILSSTPVYELNRLLYTFWFLFVVGLLVVVFLNRRLHRLSRLDLNVLQSLRQLHRLFTERVKCLRARLLVV